LIRTQRVGDDRKAKQYQPEMVLLDIAMPELNGLRSTPLLKNIAIQTEMLIVPRTTIPSLCGKHSPQARGDFSIRGQLKRAVDLVVASSIQWANANVRQSADIDQPG
jgi:DNA-binding NarL/FixJ family response regulator